jgi:lipid A 4'-phosphatase
VVFAGVFSFLVIWLVHGALYRWRPTRTTDTALEGTLERMVAWRPGKRR